MTDDHELEGLDPFDLLDHEAARLDAFFSALPDDGWAVPSACEGWSVRDVLSHLCSAEEYHQACLDGAVAEFLQGWASRGATDLHSANAIGVADYSDRSPEDAVALWRAADADTRRRFRERGDGTIDTSVGDYRSRWQAFHVASELATHADDVGVAVTPDEADDRRAWRALFSRFALAEMKPDLSITAAGGRTIVSDGSTEVDLDDDELIAAVAGRLPTTSRLDDSARSLLSTVS